MGAILKAHGETRRRVWAANSFEELPKPDGRYREDDGGHYWLSADALAVSLEDSPVAFVRYGLPAGPVALPKRWTRHTQPTAPVGAMAILRMDGSAVGALDAPYSEVSPGGYVGVDNYHSISVSPQVVEDHRAWCGVVHPIQQITGPGVFWRLL